MKKTLLIAMLLTLSSGLAFAQQQGGPGSAPDGMGNQLNFRAGNQGNQGPSVERLTERLGLDEAQAAEVGLIFEEAQLLREEERERNRAVADEIRNTIHARIMAMLSPGQQALFEQQQREREQLRQALDDLRGERGYGGGRGTGDCVFNP